MEDLRCQMTCAPSGLQRAEERREGSKATAGVSWWRIVSAAVVVILCGAWQASAADQASFINQTGVPTTMTAGETRTVSVTMQNTGTTTWTRTGQ